MNSQPPTILDRTVNVLIPTALHRRPFRSRVRVFLMGLALLATTLFTSPVSAANGDNLRTFIADRSGTDCASTDAAGGHGSVGVGIAFNGTSLLLSCYSDNTVTAVSPVDGALVAVHPITGASFLGALAWDNGRGLLWACSNYAEVGTIDLATDAFTFRFTSNGCFDGLAYDASDDTIWASGDVASSVEHFSAAGTALSSQPVSIGACGSSGIAVGGTDLFLANNGCSEIYQVAKDFSTSTLFASFPARIEDLECDNLTFAGGATPKAAIWSVDAYDNVLNAWEIPDGACTFGGGPVTKSPTSTTYTGGSSVQYSDSVTLSGTLLDTTGAPVGIAGKQLDFTVGTQSANASPTDSSGNASTSLLVTQLPGSVTTVGTAFAGDATYAASNDSDPFAINKEDCTVAYTGDTLVSAANMTTLSAQFGELDASPGDWSGKTITFTVTDASLNAQQFTATTNAAGVASTSAALGPNAYGVAVSFAGDGYYLPCATATDTLLTVTSAAAKITGGGWSSQQTGNTSFGFNVIRDVTGLSGQLQIRVKGGKDRYHSTSVLTLSSSGNAGTWTGTGRWNGVTGYTFSISVVDNGTSGKKGDTISIVIKSPSNVTVFTTGGPQPLKGGNIVVH